MNSDVIDRANDIVGEAWFAGHSTVFAGTSSVDVYNSERDCLCK